MFIFIFLFGFVRTQCPLNILIEPCSCANETITCENIHDLSFDLRSIFIKFSLISAKQDFRNFLLSNTSIEFLPNNVFVNITFENLIFRNNFALTNIDSNAFTSFENQIESFQTLNTNLSDSQQLFSLIRQFRNLRYLSLQNDRLTFIPDYAFNHTNLTHIYFGLEYTNQSQPIERIGDYAFYHLPNLHFLRIFSPNLTRITKYALAQQKRYSNDELHSNMLELYMGGQGLNSTSFELTSLNRFRNRFVFLRFYNTNITYLDENIFQPFLESNPSSIVDIGSTNRLFNCSCQSAWIQKDYFFNRHQMENRVYGYPCWIYDFTRDC